MPKFFAQIEEVFSKSPECWECSLCDYSNPSGRLYCCLTGRPVAIAGGYVDEKCPFVKGVTNAYQGAD